MKQRFKNKSKAIDESEWNIEILEKLKKKED